MEDNTFKSVAFGGFAKQDVINYIDKTAKEHAAAQEKLQQEASALRSENATLSEHLTNLRGQIEELTASEAQLRQDQENAVQTGLEPLRSENARLKAEADELRSDAEAYRQFRTRIGGIECDARRRADELENAAKGRADQLERSTRERLIRMVADFREKYQALVTEFNAASDHVTGELRRVEVNLTQLPRTLDQMGADLSELEKTLEGPKKPQ
jgi:hypothetical protein